MLPDSHRWRVPEDAAFLYWNVGCVASAKRTGDELVVEIDYLGNGTVYGRTANFAQDQRYVTRWFEARYRGKTPTLGWGTGRQTHSED
jgi:hypothetical protein